MYNIVPQYPIKETTNIAIRPVIKLFIMKRRCFELATISKRGESFRFKVSCGYDINKKQIIKTKTWTPPVGMTPKQALKEAELQAILFENTVKHGFCGDENIRLSEFSEKWLKDYGAEHLRINTYDNYSMMIITINSVLGNKKMCDIQPYHLVEFYKHLEEEGMRQDIKYVICTEINIIIKEQGFSTKSEFTEKADIALVTLRAACKGMNITKKSAERISKVLGYPLNKMFKQADCKTKISGSTALYYHHILSSMFATAVQWQVIKSNPCNRVKPPRSKKIEAKYYNEYQVEKLFECLETEPLQYRAMITLLLYSGMRRGELCGLCWDDINFTTGLIDINKSSLYTPQMGIFEDATKTFSSNRVIKLPPDIITLLNQHKIAQITQRLELGDNWHDSNKIFTSLNGQPLHPDTLSSWFGRFVKKNNLPKISLHSLRHTNATLMIANGIDIKTVSKRLGHSNVTTTGNIYTHAIQASDERASEMLENIFKRKA